MIITDHPKNFGEWVQNSRAKLRRITSRKWNNSRVSLQGLDFVYIVFSSIPFIVSQWCVVSMSELHSNGLGSIPGSGNYDLFLNVLI